MDLASEVQSIGKTWGEVKMLTKDTKKLRAAVVSGRPMPPMGRSGSQSHVPYDFLCFKWQSHLKTSLQMTTYFTYQMFSRTEDLSRSVYSHWIYPVVYLNIKCIFSCYVLFSLLLGFICNLFFIRCTKLYMLIAFVSCFSHTGFLSIFAVQWIPQNLYMNVNSRFHWLKYQFLYIINGTCYIIDVKMYLTSNLGGKYSFF